MGIVASLEDSEVVSNVDLMADGISQQTGLSIQGWIHPTYEELLQAIDQRAVHFAWLPPFTYIASHNRGVADVELVANHFGVTSYGFQILAHADSSFVSFFDPIANQSIGDAQSALVQFQDRRPCWVDERSASGYVAPLGAFSQLGVTLQEGVFTLDPGSTIRSLYVKEVCDFGATYATFGDPRTAASILEELPDVMGKVIVIWQSDPVIPNLNVTMSTELPANLRQRVIDGLTNFVKTEEGKAVISTANSYEIEDLEPVDDAIYDTLRGYVESSEIPLRSLIGR
jgi:phosphonate transport system substrate-binding protein